MQILAALIAGAALLVGLAVWHRKRPAGLRRLRAWTSLNRAVDDAAGSGERLHLALGAGNLLHPEGAAGLTGLAVLRRLAARTARSRNATVATSGDAALHLLAVDSLRAGYGDAGVQEVFQPGTGRLAGIGAFPYAAGALPMLMDENVSIAVLAGRFGPEAALLSEAAERSDALVVGATDDLTGQAVTFASASESAIGEELFAAGAYLGQGPWHTASLTLQDILRWLVILFLLAGAAARLLGWAWLG